MPFRPLTREKTAPPPPGQATARTPGACVVCHRRSDRLVWLEAGYEGRACQCGLVYVSPEPPPEQVDPLKLLHASTFYSLPAAYKVSWIERLRPRGRLLEVGCGEGEFLTAAKARGYQVAGLEPHPDRALRVSRKLGIEVGCDFIERSSLPAASFDVVYHCDLLSHFPDPLAALQAMRALVRPGGLLVLEVGILGGISPMWYRLIRRLNFPFHRWLWSETALGLLFGQAGLEVRAIQHFGMAPQVLIGSVTGLAQHLPLGALKVARRLEARGVPMPGLPDEERVRYPQARLDNFLRYRVGRVAGDIAPRLGPQTLFIALSREGEA